MRKIWLHREYVDVVVVVIRIQQQMSVVSRYDLPNMSPLRHYSPTLCGTPESGQSQTNVTNSLSLNGDDPAYRRLGIRPHDRVDDKVAKVHPNIVLVEFDALINAIGCGSSKAVQSCLTISDEARDL